ncbi:MAG: GerMN domain-containing protein [Holophagales bacterium]|nr:GerMN domain-containing protein [Holophagales bacterium]
MIALAAVTACRSAESGEEVGEDPSSDRSGPVVATEEPALDSAELYFPGDDGRLHLHRQAVPETDGPVERIEVLVEALLDGPAGVSDGSLMPPLPTGTVLGSVYLIDDDRTAVLDLRSGGEEPTDPPPTGSLQELVTVYSLVSSVVENTDGVERVVLMWNGRQPETLGGHVDLSRPLTPEPAWVAPGA